MNYRGVLARSRRPKSTSPVDLSVEPETPGQNSGRFRREATATSTAVSHQHLKFFWASLGCIVNYSPAMEA